MKAARSVEALIAAGQSHGVLVDTNLLVLLVIGTFNRSIIAEHRRLNAYTIEDFERVRDFTNRFRCVRVTPQILAETDNLARHMDPKNFEGYSQTIRSLAGRFFEIYVPMSTALESSSYSKFGLTDACILSVQKPMVVLTDDLKFHLEATKNGYESVNLNHLRFEWQ